MVIILDVNTSGKSVESLSCHSYKIIGAGATNRTEGRLFNCFISYTALPLYEEKTLIPNCIGIRIYGKHADTHDVLGITPLAQL